MNRRVGITIQVLALLSETSFPGLTRGEIRTALGLAEDTEITARIRELRDYPSYSPKGKGWNVRVDQTGKEWRYYLIAADRRRAKLFVAQWLELAA